MSALARSNLKYFNKYEGNHPKKQPATTEQARTFTYFPKLPVEIRFKIWKLSVPEPQNLDVKTRYETRAREDRSDLLYSFHTTEKRAIPQILHVNQEARSLTLESYTLESGLSNLSNQWHHTLLSSRIYVNWARDIICPIAVNEVQDNWEIFTHPRIRNIALNVRELINPIKELRKDGCLDIHSLMGMPNLEEVVFYYSDPSPQRSTVATKDRGFRLEFEDMYENEMVKELCMMPVDTRASLSYLLAARKTVNKDFDVLVQKRKARDELVKKGEEVPDEFKIEGIDGVLERRRPVVRLAYMTVNGRFCPSGRPNTPL